MINRVKPDVEDDERGYDLKFLLKLLYVEFSYIMV